MGRTCSQNGREKVFKILRGTPTGKRLSGSPRCRCDNIRMDVKQIGANTKIWVDWSQDRDYWKALVNAALNLRVSYAMELVNIKMQCVFH